MIVEYIRYKKTMTRQEALDIMKKDNRLRLLSPSGIKVLNEIKEIRAALYHTSLVHINPNKVYVADIHGSFFEENKDLKCYTVFQKILCGEKYEG
jgi:hypothetical protein